MRRFFVSLFIVTAGLLPAFCQDIVLDPRFNGTSDIYAMAFRPAPGGMECWLTVAADERDDGRRQLARVVYRDGAFTEAEVLTDPALNDPAALYDGVPAFHPCDPNQVVIVSDRPSSGTARRSNDLYMVRYKGEAWSAKRMSISSDAWDDTPCFNKQGNVLYFSSDRRRPGSGTADIYMARLYGDQWTDPVLLTQVCTDSTHETSPFVFGDTLYFSSNRSGDQDIYAIALDPQTGYPQGEPLPLAVSGVNARGADEHHPVVSPGGTWMVFSSDREVNGNRTYRLYYRRTQRTPGTDLSLRVTARTRVRDAEKVRFFGALDSIYAVATNVRVTDLATGSTQMLVTNGEGVVTIPFGQTAAAMHPTYDMLWRRFIVEAIPTQPSLVSSVDTIMIASQGCNTAIEHVIYLLDTSSMERKCEFTFRTFNVPFFVTTYWCPTTRKYRTFTPCASLFTDDLVCEHLQQPDHCTTNEVYTYKFEPAKLTRIRRGSENCVAYDEFEDNGEQWATEVDRSIEHMRDEVRSALLDGCVQSAIAAGMSVEVTYIGTTDDRTIDPDCKYTGMSIDMVRSYAPHIQIDSAIMPFIATGRSFNRGGYGGKAGGNQLLSDLRSLYFAILFDNLCRETIPAYAALQQRGQLVVRSRGQAIDNRDLPFALKRAAGVEIRIPEYTQRFSGQTPVANRRVVYCDQAMTCVEGR